VKNLILNEGYLNKKYLFEKGIKDKIFIKNKQYYDLSFCAGSLILGHNSKIFSNSLRQYIKKKISLFAHPNIYAEKFSKTIKKFFPYFSKIIFCNSGSEAIIKSLRISRTLNNKKKIICVSGGWHGSVDSLLYYPDKRLNPKKLSDGLREDDKKNLIFIPYNNLIKTKKILNKEKKNTNCIIVEPIQASLPLNNVKKYLKFIENFSKRNRCVLIFDEMITGGRLKKGSIYKKYNLKPDIVTVGKVIGGGAPIGIIGISKETNKRISKKNKKIFFGGTFSGNSLSSYLGNETLKFILKKKLIVNKVNNYSELFQKNINDFILKNNLNAIVLRHESIIRIVFSKYIPKNRSQRDFFEKKNLAKIQNFRSYLFTKRIYYPTSGIIFLSTATSIKSLNYIIKNINKGLLIYFKK